MRRHGLPTLAAAALAAAATGVARAQSIEPRAYSPAPVGVNFLVVGYVAGRGGIATDGSLPIQQPHLEQQGPVVGYVRSFGLAGRPAKVDLIVPYGSLSGSAIYEGQPVSRDVHGFNDPLLRLSVILTGARAMRAAEFRTYHQNLIVGASLQVSAPLGQYDADRLLNLGTHRWTFKPELGISKSAGPWTLEGQAAVTLYTDNDDFFGGRRRAVSPLYSVQAHGVYSFRSGAWAALDATYFEGGRTALDGGPARELQSNWRLGVTAALPVTRRASIKLNASTGVYARTGNNFDLVGIAWQYRWGGGL